MIYSQAKNVQFLKTFPYDTIYTLCIQEDDAFSLLLVSGYAARKTIGKLNVHLVKLCSLDINPEHFTYFDSI